MSDAFVASVALKVATVLGLAIVTPMFVTHLVAFYRLGVFTHDEFGLRRTLFACCSLILIELSLAGALIFNDWRGDEARCYLVPSFAALAFVMAKQAQVVFLFSRARIVHLALRLHDRRLLWFRAGVIFTATLGVAGGFYWAQFVFNHGHVNEETGVCYIYTDSPAEVITFALADAMLSIAMMLMFIIPLNTHMREMLKDRSSRIIVLSSETDSSHTVEETAWKNFSRSSLSICSGFCSLLVFAIILASAKVGNPEQEHLFIWALVVPTVESYFSLVLLHSLTTNWIPFRVTAAATAAASPIQSKLVSNAV